MREFQERNKFKNILFSKGILIALSIGILFFGHATWKVYVRERDSAASVVRSQTQLAKLKDREMLLKSELERLNTEEGIEEEIRSKYGVSKPGEQMIIIVDPEEATTTTLQESETWWDKFKGVFERKEKAKDKANIEDQKVEIMDVE